MMERLVLIFCAGKSRRWKRKIPKQLADLGTGETVLSRLLRQLEDNGITRDVRVVVGNKKEQFFEMYPDLQYVGEADWRVHDTAGAVLEMSRYWKSDEWDEVIFIWGDVVMDNQAMYQFLTAGGNLVVFCGRASLRWDTNAWRFNRYGAKLVLRGLQEVFDWKKETMWHVMMNLIKITGNEDFIHHPHSYVNDVDTIERLDKIVAHIKKTETLK